MAKINRQIAKYMRLIEQFNANCKLLKEQVQSMSPHDNVHYKSDKENINPYRYKIELKNERLKEQIDKLKPIVEPYI